MSSSPVTSAVVLYETESRNFQRVLKESSIHDLGKMLSRKLQLKHQSIQLIQIWNGKEVDLFDDDDFVAFSVRAQREGFATVRVIVNNKSESVGDLPSAVLPSKAVVADTLVVASESQGRKEQPSSALPLMEEGKASGSTIPEKKRRKEKRLGKPDQNKNSRIESSETSAPPERQTIAPVLRAATPDILKGHSSLSKVMGEPSGILPKESKMASKKRTADEMDGASVNGVQELAAKKEKRRKRQKKKADINGSAQQVQDNIEAQGPTSNLATAVGEDKSSMPKSDSDPLVTEHSTTRQSPASLKPTTGLRGETRRGVSVPCPVCFGPFHLRIRCPIVQDGPEAINRRIDTLKKDVEVGVDDGGLIKELELIAQKIVRNSGSIIGNSLSPITPVELTSTEVPALSGAPGEAPVSERAQHVHGSSPMWTTNEQEDKGTDSDADGISDQINESQYLLAPSNEYDDDEQSRALLASLSHPISTKDHIFSDDARSESLDIGDAFEYHEDDPADLHDMTRRRRRRLSRASRNDFTSDEGSANSLDDDMVVSRPFQKANHMGDTPCIHTAGDDAFRDILRLEDTEAQVKSPTASLSPQPSFSCADATKHLDALKESTRKEATSIVSYQEDHLFVNDGANASITLNAIGIILPPGDGAFGKQSKEYSPVDDPVLHQAELEPAGAAQREEARGVQPERSDSLKGGIGNATEILDGTFDSSGTQRRNARQSAPQPASQPIYRSLSSISVLPSQVKPRLVSTQPPPNISSARADDDSSDEDSEDSDRRDTLIPPERRAGAISATLTETKKGILSLWRGL